MKKVVLVTGGGRGIGLGISQAFLQAGYQVLVVQRSPLPDELRQPDVDYRAQDLGHSQSFDDLLAFVEQRYGRLDVLVNNAGMMLEQSMGQLQKAIGMPCWLLMSLRRCFLAKHYSHYCRLVKAPL